MLLAGRRKVSGAEAVEQWLSCGSSFENRTAAGLVPGFFSDIASRCSRAPVRL